MIPFLKTVALHYRKEIEANGPMTLADCLFVFPNRRSGLFFTKYLGEGLSCPVAVPRTTTIGDLFSEMTQLHVADRTSLLFRLFEIYRRTSRRDDRDEFDQFVFWGDMLISDFDDIDKYLVDARQLFQNIRDLKEIDTYFAGYSDEFLSVIRSFWSNVMLPSSAKENDPKREAFLDTWNILFDLYTEFRKTLLSEELAYEGMIERQVIETLAQEGASLDALLPNYRKVVFVGLTAINKCERRLMSLLKLEGRAEFCWDYADPRLHVDSVISSAAYFTKTNLSDFPNALSEEELQEGLVPDDQRHYQLFSVPSGVGQTNVARQRLIELGDQGMDTAIVLADEKLLLPMLYAIPQGWEDFNVTMGYSLRRTPIHAEVQSLIGKDRSSTWQQAYAKLQEIVAPREEDNVTAEFRACYRDTLERLQREAATHTIQFSAKTFFLLLQKLVAGISVPFSGEPLHGLQVMGVLETRALDFRNIIILNANEGILPAKPMSNSFVPMNLRSAFKMPTQQHKDAVMAYHFYRLMSRAENVTLVYDSRTEGTQTGEESRYVKQLRYLLNRNDLNPQTVSHNISIPQVEPYTVFRTPEVQAELQQFVNSSERKVSVTALADYITCPLKFYLKNVKGLREEDDEEVIVDDRSFGNIMHNVMQQIYEPAKGKMVQADNLTHYLNNKAEVLMMVRAELIKELHVDSVEGYNILVSEVIADYIIRILTHDRSLTPFTYISSEDRRYLAWTFAEGKYVTFKYIIDRIDKVNDTLRIVDYKSGSAKNKKVNFATIDELFDPKGCKEARQVMLYGAFLRRTEQYKDVPIAPNLYFVSDFRKGQKNTTSIGKDPVANVAHFDNEVTELLNALLSEIFDSEKPFAQCDEPKRCKYCDFLDICKRTVPEW